jgi:hypothetical protein
VNKFKAALEYMRNFEPATLKGVWVAVIALLASLGIVVTPAVDNKANAIIGGAIAVVSLLQAVWTRGSVYAPAVMDAITDAYGIPQITTLAVKAGTVGNDMQDTSELPPPDAQEAEHGAPVEANADNLDLFDGDVG